MSATRTPVSAAAFAALWVALLVISAVLVWLALGISFSDGMRDAFKERGAGPDAYETFQSRYINDENDIVVLLSAPDFAAPEPLNAVAEFIEEALFEFDLPSVVSSLSVLITEPDGTRGYLLPLQPLSQPEMAARMDRALAQSAGLQRFLSPDRSHFVISFGADGLIPDNRSRSALIRDLGDLARDMTGPYGVTVEVSGYPAIRSAIVALLTSEIGMLIAFGLVVGTVVATVTMGNMVLGAVTFFSAASALVWSVGTMSALGFEVNVISISLPALILVLASANSVHLSLETRRLYLAVTPSAIWQAVRHIWPASIVAGLTTAVALASLMLSPSQLIWSLGFAGLGATLASTLAVFAVQPLVMLTVERTIGLHHLFKPGLEPRLQKLELGILPRVAVRAPWIVSGAGVVLIAATGYLYSQLVPSYSLYEGLDPETPTLATITKIETEMAPLGAIQFEHPLHPIEDLGATVEAFRAAEPDLRILSIADVVEPGTAITPETLARLPDNLLHRFVSKDGKTALVSVLYRYDGSAEARDTVNDLRATIEARPELSRLSPPTGMITISSFMSKRMLDTFTICFIFAVVLSGLLIMVWLRNPIVGGLSILPNILPVTVVGAVIYFSSGGLNFTSGIALTVAFGIAIDDTVHALNRLRINADRAFDADVVLRAVRQVGPALMITSLVLSLGMLGTMWSEMPATRYFGQLLVSVFVLALIADLLLLPALLTLACRYLPQSWIRIRT